MYFYMPPTSPELEDSVLEDVPGVSSLVHQVKLSQHTDGTNTCTQYVGQGGVKIHVNTTQYFCYHLRTQNKIIIIPQMDVHLYSKINVSALFWGEVLLP